MRLARLLVLVIVAALVMHAGAVRTASAGGSWLEPVQDRYESGDTATMVGYTGGGSFGSIDDGPFNAYLFRLRDVDSGIHPRAIPLYLGELDVIRTGDVGWTAMRAAITFELPEFLDDGIYYLEYCNAGCEERLGDLIGGFLHIGVDNEYPIIRDWPRNEPEIANLAADAHVAGAGSATTAGEIREAGFVPLALPVLSGEQQRDLNERYRQCALEGGVDPVGVQVLVDDQGIPWWVKTGINVAAEIHGPCMEEIGGPQTNQPSWGN